MEPSAEIARTPISPHFFATLVSVLPTAHNELRRHSLVTATNRARNGAVDMRLPDHRTVTGHHRNHHIHGRQFAIRPGGQTQTAETTPDFGVETDGHRDARNAARRRTSDDIER